MSRKDVDGFVAAGAGGRWFIPPFGIESGRAIGAGVYDGPKCAPKWVLRSAVTRSDGHPERGEGSGSLGLAKQQIPRARFLRSE